MSSISSVAAQASPPRETPPPAPRQKVDADGDFDGSKPGEVESKPAPRPVSDTVGNYVNTTA